MLSPHALGATLYMPATRSDLLDVVQGRKLPELRSLVICLEDAVRHDDIPHALRNISQLLEQIERGGREHGPLLFIRPRSADMAKHLSDLPLIHRIDGYVAPKFTLHTLPDWLDAVNHTQLRLMPTLETREVFDVHAMLALRDGLLESARERILALRIGGNDLMGLLALRRIPSHTAYDGPLGYVIGMLSGVLGSAGFSLTGPVCESLDTPEILAAEVERDMAHGLVGKTVIHPSQIAIVHQALAVSALDYLAAQKILSEDAPAVFRFNDSMCEPTTHRAWAGRILERARYFGHHQPHLQAVGEISG